MSKLHLANTYFEEEMAQETLFNPSTFITQNPLHRKLQWLPFLYADKEDGVMVTEPPPSSFFTYFSPFIHPKLHLFTEKKTLSYSSFSYWGASPSIKSWAESRGLSVPMPPWDIVCQVNSKEFSYTHSIKLKGSALLYTKEEVTSWCNEQKGAAVLKNCYGLSGRGHLHLPQQTDRIQAFVVPEFRKNRPIIAEPWVKRTLDFSTQWEILQQGEIQYLGKTLCINDEKGRYKETRIGDFPLPPFFEKHLECAKEILQKIKNLGYFGNVGLDAMIYEDDGGKIHLQPIVEVNARKTMGWAALKIGERHLPKQSISLSFSLNKKGFAVILTPWSF